MTKKDLIKKAEELLAMADNGTDECGYYNDGFIDGVIYAFEALSQHVVSGSLLSKTYEIDFGGNLKCKIRVCGNELEVEAAMNGWGNGIPCSEISVVEVQ